MRPHRAPHHPPLVPSFITTKFRPQMMMTPSARKQSARPTWRWTPSSSSVPRQAHGRSRSANFRRQSTASVGKSGSIPGTQNALDKRHTNPRQADRCAGSAVRGRASHLSGPRRPRSGCWPRERSRSSSVRADQVHERQRAAQVRLGVGRASSTFSRSTPTRHRVVAWPVRTPRSSYQWRSAARRQGGQRARSAR